MLRATETLIMKNKVTADQISKSRLLLENPYAYLDEKGGYSACSASKSINVNEIRKPGLQNKRILQSEIENSARNLQKFIWKENKTSNVMDILNPIRALEYLGYEVLLVSELGQFESDQGPAEIAGYIDSSKKIAGLSTRYPKHVQNFTAAHELGHAVLHDASAGMHRDRALDGRKSTHRDSKEFEADKFASIFLMPEKLVRKEFEKRFLTKYFITNEESAFLLSGKSLGEFKSMINNRRQLARLLAEATRYNQSFRSMKEIFNVSTEAMAIRLEELNLF